VNVDDALLMLLLVVDVVDAQKRVGPGNNSVGLPLATQLHRRRTHPAAGRGDTGPPSQKVGGTVHFGFPNSDSSGS